MPEPAGMSDRAEVRGPSARQRRTTISGGGGQSAVSGKQTNGNRCPDAGEKPPQSLGKKKKDERNASNNGKVDRGMVISGQQLTNSPRKQNTAEDITEGLR